MKGWLIVLRGSNFELKLETRKARGLGYFSFHV